MILEKVYDELTAQIEDLKKKVASISGGSAVTITPTLEAGEKIADFSIDGESGALYAPDFMAVYSSTPKKVAKWVDGRDVMRIVKNFESVTMTSGSASLSFDLTGVDEIIDARISLIPGTTGQKYFLPMARVLSAENLGYTIRVNSDGTITVQLVSPGTSSPTYSSFSDIDVIIDYIEVAETSSKTTKKKK